jgi:hypothetical protein
LRRAAAASLRAAGCAAALALAACASAPKWPAQGTVFGQRVETTVDSPIARYYLEHYLAGLRTDEAMHARIESLERRYPAARPTQDDLARLAQDSSIDFAALFLAQRLLADECNRAINREFASAVESATMAAATASRYVVLFAPGWDYVDLGAVTGADFARPRALAARHGFENVLAPLVPRGSIEGNARIVAQEIARLAGSNRRIIIASASTAGAAVQVALAEHVPAADRAKVAGWLNIGGLLHGSPIVDYLLEWPQRPFFEAGVWWTGWDRDAIVELGMARGRTRFARLRLDPAIPVVDYVGIPLSGQVGKHARSNYPVLARWGPNDGLTLLADALVPGSLTIVAFGRDHFIADDPLIDAKAVALMRIMARVAEGEIARGCPKR